MSSKRNVRRKSCEGKVRHKTQEGAIIAARILWKLKSEYTRAYHCRLCRGFHTGHPPRWLQRII